tara:strand:+ start:336 stop:821 length:486 start_codon:yes stop_codon:yes gene_type:complete
MKNLLYTTFILIFISCETKQEENKIIEYPFKASYSSDISMGDPSLSNIVLDLQKAANEGNFEKTMSFLHDDFEGTLADGSVAKKEDVIALYKPIFETTKFNIVPNAWFSIHVNDLDHDWVILWTKEDLISSSDTTSLFAQESFQIKDGKIIGMNQFQRPIN